MDSIQLLDDSGAFLLNAPEGVSGLYFPLAGEKGLKSAITPNLGGDCKLDQETFLLEPVSVEDLHDRRSTRNFWCVTDKGCWSATGVSARQEADRFTPEQDKSTLTAAFMRHSLCRQSSSFGLRAQITSFVPYDENVEVMSVRLTNTSAAPQRVTAIAAVPIYGRSADNLRDHRNVTSMLHRVRATQYGVLVKPTMSFDEKGHRENRRIYYVLGSAGDGAAPAAFYPTVEGLLGEGGSFLKPRAVYEDAPGVPAGTRVDGREAMGGLRFPTVTLKPGETTQYTVLLGVSEDEADIERLRSALATPEQVRAALERTEAYWQQKVNVRYHTGDERFDRLMRWVSFQPLLRRIYGCSFLPHHDYGRGGRGWRDLWQDSLALLLTDPSGVRENLLSYFAGVRTDGTNATIIGAAPGEFKADRNGIPRVWMDHGFWPLLTVALYLDETGDDGFLLEERPYFADDLPWRGEWARSAPPDGPRTGTVLEHLLVQLAAAFFDVGEHGHMRLRGADWNDGLDMARERGESVAFTAAYAYGFSLLAGMMRRLAGAGREVIAVSGVLAGLLDCPETIWGRPEEMRAALLDYCAGADRAWDRREYPTPILAGKLNRMAQWLRAHIAAEEWVGDGVRLHWFNSYYDNSGRQVEGLRGEAARMMLTGQVFTILSGAADEDRVGEIIRAADWYLFQSQRGGYCLNTDFGEVKLDMGRMFGFAYGHKENGAVFSHMAVMYAYALYARGFASQGWKALRQLFLQSGDFGRSRILPGIPEYFDDRGQGMYPYLTGAGSWLLLTMQTQAFGVRGRGGDLLLEPKLTAEQFDGSGAAELCCTAAGRRLRVRYENAGGLDCGRYRLGTVICGEKQWTGSGGRLVIPRGELPEGDGLLELTAELISAGEGEN